MRGSVDQLPIILEVNQPTTKVHNGRPSDNDHDGMGLKSNSSNDSFGPPTPPEGIEQNHDRRYIYIRKEGIGIPLTYDEPKEPKKPPRDVTVVDGSLAEAVRGKRENPPKLDTQMPQKNGTESAPLLNAREPSPYSYPPGPAARSRFSGEYFLSPDTLSPKVKLLSDTNSATLKKSEAGHTYREPLTRTSGTLAATVKPTERPAFNRHVSASAYPGQPLHGSSHSGSSRHDFSSDESDDDSDRYSVIRSDKRSSRDPYEWSTRPRHASALRYEENVRRDPEDGQENITPPSRSISAFGARTLPAGVPALGALGPGVTNALLSDPHWKRPSSASRVSPSTSPYSSPPLTPRIDAPRYGETLPVGGTRSRPSSRPTTPSSADQMQPRSTAFEASHEMHSTAHPSINTRSSRTSPLASPQSERPTSSSGPRIAIHAPSSAYKQKSLTIADNGSRIEACGEAPFILSPTPQMPPRSRSRQRAPASLCESPQRTPNRGRSPCGSFEVPHPSLQAYASSVNRERSPKPAQKGAMIMPSCPRLAPVAGYHDWYILNGMTSFNICPRCREHVEGAGYGGHFTASPLRSHGYERRCDFGIPWVRMAWLLTLKQKRPDANLLYSLAEVRARESPCPGRIGATGPWFRITDPVAGRTIANFDVCPSCVRSLETIFPALQGVFQHMPSATQQNCICDLRTDSKRFATYVDMLEEIANHAVHTRQPPDTRRFVDLARTMASIRECPRDDMIVGQAWHVMPQIPELTVCEECYDEVVWPLVEARSGLAGRFNHSMQLVAPPDVGVSCQLYSPRMRKVFEEACRREDLVGLRNAASQRLMVERDMQARRARLGQLGGREEMAREAERIRLEWSNWE